MRRVGDGWSFMHPRSLRRGGLVTGAARRKLLHFEAFRLLELTMSVLRIGV